MAMDDPSGGMFHDPSSFFNENSTLNSTLDPLMGGENYLNLPDHQQPCHDLIINSNILDPNGDDPLSDHFVWDLCNDVEVGQGCNFSNFDDTVFEDTNPILPPRPRYNCTFCQILREITHTNGSIVKRLEIHGKFRVITHAVLGIYGFDPSIQGEDIQMIDFGNESTQMVKKFMVQYFEACKQEGYDLLQDPLSNFYEALCVGLNESDYPIEFLQFSPEDAGECPNSRMKNPESGSNQVGLTKIPLAMQRERTRNLRLKDFVDYSDLPIEDAARRMNICPTVMKKICRKNGVTRWPHRKIKSIRKKISKKTRILDAGDEQEKARALEDIQKHQQELARIYEDFNK